MNVEKNTLIPVTDCEATKVLFVLSVVNSSISNMMDTIGNIIVQKTETYPLTVLAFQFERAVT